ncbi:MAG: bis(5'-nucleosyl)-tetraphosphatase (symmetrical) YqeK [Clostridia bacterium]|nr:bis(5'-nucleosyl)-tetraphosphatase (symmetrical) YqeK [Clostridia bacterium]
MTVDFKEEIKKYVSGKRYDHSIAVEEECRVLAGIFSLDERDTERLSIAAYLHDMTKQLDTDGHIALCERFSIPYTKSDIASPKTFHAKTGAALARENYPDLCDDFVFNCIRYHTTGRANMTLAESILYLADYIEPTRTFRDCVALRNYFYNGLGNTEKHVLLRNTLIMSFDMTISDLVSSGRMIDFDTIASRNHLLMQRFDQTKG